MPLVLGPDPVKSDGSRRPRRKQMQPANLSFGLPVPVIGEPSAPGGNRLQMQPATQALGHQCYARGGSGHRVGIVHMISPTVGTLPGPSPGTGCRSVRW